MTNFTTENVGHFVKTLSYETAMGKTLTIDYEYYVAPVLYIDVPLNVVRVKQGEEISMGFYVVFDMSGISDYSNDKYLYSSGYYGDYDPYFTLSGYDTTVLGEQTVYVEWHGYTAQYQINVYEETQYIEPRSTVKTVYTTGESFEMPTMYFVDTNLGTEVDVTSKCEVSYFSSAWTGSFTTTIIYYNEELSLNFNYKVSYEVVEQGYIPSVSHIYVGNHKSNYKFGDFFEAPEVYAYWTNGDETLADSNEVQFSGYDSCKLGRQEITCEYQGCYTTYEIYVTSNGTNQAFELSTSTLRLDKNYATGNYGSYNKLGYYRLARSGSNFVLIPYSSISDGSIDIDSRNGSLYSYDSFKDIQTIQLTYSTSGTGSVKPYISYGEQTLDGVGKQTLEFSSSSTTVTLDLSSKNANYFKIDGGDVRFTIQSLYIEYTGENTPNGDSIIRDDNFTNYRINPTVFTGTLEDGVSSVTVPVEADIEDGHYHVTDVKTYTYYSFSYASSHTDMINNIAMTDPVDVANYYTIFQEFPANYCLSSNWSSTYAVFGDKTRCVSQYERTDGYALSVPYAANPSTNKPLYYEFDIAIDSSYNNSSRGVARVVAWKYGFSATGYDSNPVCTYTDDHYATFMEYNNLGGWNKRFDAQQMFTLVNWKNAVNLIQY